MTKRSGKAVPTSRLARGTALGAAAAGHLIRSKRNRMAMLGRSAEVRARLAEDSTLYSAELLVGVLGTMKGAAMKLGQMLSVLDLDLVPESHRELFRDKFAKLRDNAPPTSFAQMRAVIEEDAGRPLTELFADFSPEPVAAASIGQVYRARTHDGRDVAVKVQYPGIGAAVRADLRNLSMFRTVLQKSLPWITPAIIDELARNLEGELDFRQEAANQQRVSQLYAGHPFITVPAPVPELSSGRVLVSEFFSGQSFAEIRTLPAEERDRIGEIIYRFYVGSLFNFSEFCGDPHPGNFLYAGDGRVCFIDFGLYNKMSKRHRDFEIACLRAAAEDRGADLYQLMVSHGVIDPEAGVTADECLDYVLGASQWCLIDEELTIDPEVASGAFLLAIDPRASDFTGMKHQTLPPEHLFSRRADFLTFGVLGQLGATANWHRIAREWIYRDAPVTDLGRAHERWVAERKALDRKLLR